MRGRQPQICAAGPRVGRMGRLGNPDVLFPFVLSLSKHRSFFRRRKKEQPFDKLRANGVGVANRRSGERDMDFAMPADLQAYLDELDAFIEAEIRPLELADDNIDRKSTRLNSSH